MPVNQLTKDEVFSCRRVFFHCCLGNGFIIIKYNGKQYICSHLSVIFVFNPSG